MTRTNLSTAEKLISRYPWYTLGYVDVYEEICRMDPDSIGIYLSKAAARVYSREYLYDFFRKDTAFPGSDSNEEPIHKDIEKQPLNKERIDREQVEQGRFKEGSDEEEIDQERVAEVFGDSEKSAEKDARESGKTGMNEIELEEIDFVTDDMPRFVLAGGDYFSRRELDQLELDKEKPLDHFIVEKPTLLRGAVQGKKPVVKEEEVDVSDFFDDASFYTETLANIYTEQGFYKRAVDVYAKLILLYPEKSSYFASLVSNLKEKYNI
jgi:hypothetical protein